MATDISGIDMKRHKSEIASPSWMVRLTRSQLENVGVFCEGNVMGSRCGFTDAIAGTMYLARG